MVVCFFSRLSASAVSVAIFVFEMYSISLLSYLAVMVGFCWGKTRSSVFWHTSFHSSSGFLVFPVQTLCFFSLLFLLLHTDRSVTLSKCKCLKHWKM